MRRRADLEIQDSVDRVYPGLAWGELRSQNPGEVDSVPKRLNSRIVGELDRAPEVASQPTARPTQDRVGEGQAIIHLEQHRDLGKRSQ